MKKVMFLMALAVAFLPGCSSNDEPEVGGRETPRPQFTEPETEAASNINGFGLEFFKAVAEEKENDENFVFSPLNMTTGLAMAANTGNKDAICRAIGCEDLESLNSFVSKYMRWLLNAGGNVKMCFSNSVWYDSKYTLNPKFSDVAKDVFACEIFSRDFNNEDKLVDEINGWASQKTNGMINEVIRRAPETAALMSALYFKGRWSEPFKAENTVKANFYGMSGTGRIDMMKNRLVTGYFETEDAQVLRMSFGPSFCAVIMLPKEGNDVEDLVKGKIDDIWMNMFSRRYFRPMEVDLSFPKFEITPENIEMDDVLKSIGINDLTSNITKEVQQQISVFQTSTIKFDENGAEAASVTNLGTTASGPNKQVTMTIDRPFLFFINEVNSGLCLFAGKVANL